MSRAFVLNPGDLKFVLTDYKINSVVKGTLRRDYLRFVIMLFHRPGESEKRYHLRIKNNCAWRNTKGIIVWRTSGRKGKDGYTTFYDVELGAVLWKEIRDFIDKHWGMKLQFEYLPKFKRNPGFANTEDALAKLEGEPTTK